QAEDGIRDFHVTGVQTCALPILALNRRAFLSVSALALATTACSAMGGGANTAQPAKREGPLSDADFDKLVADAKKEGKLTFYCEIGRASCREGGQSGADASGGTG